MSEETVTQIMKRMTDYFERHKERLMMEIFKSREIMIFDEKSSAALVVYLDKHMVAQYKTYVAEVIPFYPEFKN